MSMLASMVYRSSIDIKGVELFLYTFLSVMKKGKYKKNKSAQFTWDNWFQ